MDYRTLGGSGCAVSSLALGTMTFGAETAEPEAHRLLDRFLEAGGTLVDTADVYGAGRSEEIIGRWFASRPAQVSERVVLATKGRFPLDDSPNGSGLSARHLTRALDGSLRRLGLDAVDLYQVHAFDPWTPLGETLRTLDGFVRAGKVRYYGLSNFTGWQLTKAVHLARAMNIAGPVTLQPQYSLLARQIEWEAQPRAGAPALVRWQTPLDRLCLASAQSGNSIGPMSANTSPGPGLSGWVRPPRWCRMPQTAFSEAWTAPSTHAGVQETSSPAMKMPRCSGGMRSCLK